MSDKIRLHYLIGATYTRVGMMYTALLKRFVKCWKRQVRLRCSWYATTRM